ncbi:G patch domain-containing protein 1 [Nymphon striatum]|nr:G patch domain-containing protein 1 [Nymphon striatum]
MGNEEECIAFGTPFDPLEEDEAPKKRPMRVEDQIVTDEKGRRRFHGAFTGGFSAGYYNTVGTKEGWTPATFISSRSKKAELKSQTTLDIMDEEDKGEHGISHQAVHVTSVYQDNLENIGKRSRAQFMKSGPIPGEPALSNLIRPLGETIGFKLLKKMGWKSGQGIGPRIKYKDKRKQMKQNETGDKIYTCSIPDDIYTDDEDENAKNHTFAPVDMDCVPYTAKDNNFGLGYEGLKKEDYLSSHINLFEPTSTKAVFKNKSRLAISGQAFGVGAFEVDDDDIYARDDMARYDFTLGAEEKQETKKKKFSKTLNEALNGFHLSSKSKIQLKVFAPPIIPKDFKPIHRCKNLNEVKKQNTSLQGMDRHSLTVSERSHMIGENNMSSSSSVFDLIAPQEKAKLELAKKFTSTSIPTNCIKEESSQPKVTSQISSAICSTSESEHFKPFKSDVEKQNRYEKYLTLLKIGQHTDRINSLQPSSMTEWEKEREKDEFIRAAYLYRPLTGPMSTRFTLAKHLDNESTVEVSIDKVDNKSDEMKAAQLKMFGKMTRRKFEWHPEKLICKRFNVPNPYPGSELVGLPKVQKEKYSLFNFLTLTDDSDRTTVDNENPVKVEKTKETDKSNENSDQSKNIFDSIPDVMVKKVNEERPPMDFFKAIFASDESSSDDESEISDDDDTPDRVEDSSAQHNSLSLPQDKLESPNSKVNMKSDFIDGENTKIASGVFANINFEELNTVPNNNLTNIYPLEKGKNFSSSTSIADPDIQYGPALPPPTAGHIKPSKKKKKKEKSKKSKHKSKKSHKAKKSKHKKRVKNMSDSSDSSDSEDSHMSDRKRDQHVTKWAGYDKASKTFDPTSLDVDLKGRSFVITGANSGIGKAAATELAKKGGTIHMVCRDQNRGNEAKDEIVKMTGNLNVHLHIVDMSHPREVHKFCENFVNEQESLDALLNNAGCMENDQIVDEDGLEKNFATNVLGEYALVMLSIMILFNINCNERDQDAKSPYIMTLNMIPLLEKSPNHPRVLNVSSGGMLLQRLDVDDLQSKKVIPFDGTVVYSQNKRQQVIMMEKLAEKYPHIYFYSMSPGWATTPAVKKSIPKFYETWKSYFRTPEEGADTLIWLAASSDSINYPNGSFFQDRKPISKHIPLAWTQETPEESSKFMSLMKDFMIKFSDRS